MANYVYSARDEQGQTVKGTLRAASEERAMALLRSHRLTPISIAPTENTSFWNRSIGRSVNTKDLILFSRQGASMIQAGVPIVQALQVLQKQIDNTAFRKVLEELTYSVESGESLSIAMSKYPNVFSPFILGVVRTGEASGRLSQALQSVADHLEQDYVFTRKVRAALTYPVFVLFVVVILTIVMFVYVLPQLVDLFADAGVQLPLPTRILIAITEFSQHYWLPLLLVVVLLGIIFRSYSKTPDGRYALSTYVLHVPLVSTLFQKVYLARLTSILHTLFTSDVPIIESLKLAKEAVGNKVYQRILDDTIKAIEGGSSISVVWQHEAFIPPMLTAMVGVGERSGEIGKAFSEANKFFKRDVDGILDSITVLLEPILLLILGVGVGIVVGAVLLPIYNLVLVF